MPIDISLVSSNVVITEVSGHKKGWKPMSASYEFDANNNLLLTINGQTRSIGLADLTVSGVAPANVNAAITALAAVFLNAGVASSTIQTLSGLAPVWDINSGDWAYINAPTGNVNLTTSNVPTPGAGVLHFKQDATGNRTLQINGTLVAVDPTGSAITRVDFSFDGANYVYVSSYSSGGSSSGTLTEYTGSAAPSAPASGITLFSSKKANSNLAFIDKDGIITEIQPPLFGNGYMLCRNNVGSAATTTIGGTTTSAGTLATAPYSNTTYYNQVTKLLFSTTTGVGNTALLRTNSVFAYRQWGFFYSITFGIHTVGSTTRLFSGLAGLAAIGNVEPSALTDIIGVGKDSTDTNLQIMSNDGAGTATKVDLGASFPANTSTTDWYELRLYCKAGDSVVYYSVHRKNTGDIATGSISTNLPATNTPIPPQIAINNGTTGEIVTFGFGTFYLTHP